MLNSTNFDTAQVLHAQLAPELDQLFDRYADSVIGSCGEIDAIELHGVRQAPGDGGCIIDEANAEFFSVYVHLAAGGVECVGDFSCRDNAKEYAIELGELYGWPVRDFVFSQLN